MFALITILITRKKVFSTASTPFSFQLSVKEGWEYPKVSF